MGQLKKILLVDDDDDLREALTEQLVMTEDFEVFEAENGKRNGPRQRRPVRFDHPRRRPARHGRSRTVPLDAQTRCEKPD